MSQNENDMKHPSPKCCLTRTIAKKAKAPDSRLFKVPCYSQGTERCVRLVTEASGKVYGFEERHGFILAHIKSQQAMKKFNTKSQFKM
ncbi:hypothetical protein AVEN_19662-1 [Araneus ventricosus]|uniref:Uncharacterized protein n=1 Tax=Araneus ventricosus TaxID=182803 RepID=A0A4Y2C5L7_ARAVE|nr:hypothetical protein AVEN_19662-1 [Araneus ventricosus]